MLKKFIPAVLIFLSYVVPVFSFPVMDLPPDYRKWYRNPDGSCVQCSIGMVGLWQNVPQAATLLWDTIYGPAERGGSWEERVQRYSEKRGMKIYNISGDYKETIKWIEWAALTGRFCAMTFGVAHMQTLYGWDPIEDIFYVVDNNSPTKVSKYTRREFIRMHTAGYGDNGWVIILDYPPAPQTPNIGVIDNSKVLLIS